MAEQLPNLKKLYDRQDMELAFAIRDALSPALQSKMSTGTILPACPLNGQLHFLEPEQQVYTFDAVRNLWLSQELITATFARRNNNVSNNVLLHTTDSLSTTETGFPVPWPGETVIVGMSADISASVAYASFQAQANGFATITALNVVNASYATNFALNGLVPSGEYLTVRTNGVSANLRRPSVTMYLKRYKIAA